MGFFDFFKPSPFSKAHSMLKKNNLVAQAMILKQANQLGYTSFSKKNDPSVFTDSHRDIEIKMLVGQKVNIMAAAGSINRFKKAKEICKECKLIDGENLFKQYVNLYEYYVTNYNKLGGPSSW
jgi:hypothetical protein|tara:strand:+ start:3838 stop:4206 length:369 start_codon:yes stop_codon:yes gene_type:complete